MSAIRGTDRRATRSHNSSPYARQAPKKKSVWHKLPQKVFGLTILFYVVIVDFWYWGSSELHKSPSLETLFFRVGR